VKTIAALSPVRLASPFLGVVSVGLVATACGYGRLLAQQGDWPDMTARQAFVLSLLVALAIISAIGTIAHRVAIRAAIAAACAAALLPLGFLALFSIGLVLVVAGILALIAWVHCADAAQRRDTLALSAVSAVVAIVVLAVGFVATG
jgi:hypothetical protein